ncbi:MAG: hypothetical protein ACYCPO_05995 [Acidobacteriaceae bacterium]
MKKPIIEMVLFCLVLSLSSASAAGNLKRQPTSHPRTYSSRARQPSAGRPYYGGGQHTTSHGGKYPGATNPHHRNGHYNNWRSDNRYGVHKP